MSADANQTLTPMLRGSNSTDVIMNDNSSSSDPYSWSNSGWLLFTVVVASWFVAAVIIRLCAFKIWNEKDRLSEFRNNKRFEHTVSKEKSASRRSGRNNSGGSKNAATVSPIIDKPTIFQRCEMDCYTRALEDEDGKTKSGYTKIKLLHEEPTGGYCVSGICVDENGLATITDGYSSYAGDAWWIQEVLDDDEECYGLKVYNKGKIDFTLGKFEGCCWLTNTGNEGQYSKFEAKCINMEAPSKHVSFDIPISIEIQEDLRTTRSTAIDNAV